MAKARGIEPRFAVLETAVFPLDDAFVNAFKIELVDREGFEPPAFWV